jgi:hypothetical protein
VLVAVALALAGCGEDAGDRESFCATAERLGSDPGLLTGDVTPAQLDRLAGIYQELDDTAPEQVREDVSFLSDAVDRLREGDVSFVVDEEQAAELVDAFEGLTDYLRDECPRPDPSTGALRSRRAASSVGRAPDF